MKELKFKRLNGNEYIPKRAYEHDAGYDICLPYDAVIEADNVTTLDLNVSFGIEPGHTGLLFPRSSLAKNNIVSIPVPIDAGYNGSIKLIVRNYSKEYYQVSKGDRLCQLVIMPIVTPLLKEVDLLPTSERGNKGFGSSGLGGINEKVITDIKNNR